MNFAVLLTILFSVSCSACAQMLLKRGMVDPVLKAQIAAKLVGAVAWSIAGNPWVISGLGLYFIGAVAWLFVLAKIEVSVAYPFVSLGFLLTLILGHLMFGESVTLSKLIGTVLVAGGVYMVAVR